MGADRITVNATESRRLSTLRRLGGNWAIAYAFHAPPAKQEAISTQAAASDTASFKTQFTTAFKTALTTAGAPIASVNAVTVTTFTSVVEAPPGMATSMRTTTVVAGPGTAGAYK